MMAMELKEGHVNERLWPRECISFARVKLPGSFFFSFIILYFYLSLGFLLFLGGVRSLGGNGVHMIDELVYIYI